MPLCLTGWLPVWDIERRSIAIDEVVDWTTTFVRDHGIECDDLSALDIDGPSARRLAQDLTAASLSPELRRPLHAAVRAAIPELLWDQVWIQTFAHYRILVPEDPVAPVPPHTDYGFGHSLDERNVWVPITDAEDREALHLLGLTDSLSWLAQSGQLEGVLPDDGAPQPVPVKRGELLLFTPLHIHRARMPSVRTRVSIDLRIAPAAAHRADLTFSPLWSAP